MVRGFVFLGKFRVYLGWDGTGFVVFGVGVYGLWVREPLAVCRFRARAEFRN